MAKAEMTKAEMAKAEMARAEMAKAEMARAEMAKDEMTKAEMTKAEMARAEMARAEMAKDEMARDEMAKDEITKDKMTIQELRKKKSEWDLVTVIGFFFSILMVGIFILQINAALKPRILADAVFTLYDVDTIHRLSGNGGWKTTFYYKAEFVDPNGVSRTGLVEEDVLWNIYLFENYSEKLSETVNNPPYQNGEIVTIYYYSGNFQDGDTVHIYDNPVKGLIFLGVLAGISCLSAGVAMMESSKLSKMISDAVYSK